MTEGVRTIIHPVKDLAKARTLYSALLGAVQPYMDQPYYVGFNIQGALSKAEHSQTWVLAADVRELIATGGSGFFPPGSFPILNACQQQVFLTAYGQTGFPLVFTVGGKQAVGQDGVIAENNPNMGAKLGGNGKGIDHLEVSGDAIFAAFGAGYNAAFGAAC